MQLNLLYLALAFLVQDIVIVRLSACENLQAMAYPEWH